MRRRRFPRRFPGRRPILVRPLRPGLRPPLGPRIQQELRRAHNLMDQGDHANAAAIFEDLGQKALDLGMPRRGINLLLQAGQAYMLAGQLDKGMDLVQDALGIIAEHEEWEALYRAGNRAVATLNENGHKDQARDLQLWLDKTLAGHEDAIRQAKANMGRLANLPAKCPSCGASVRPDEVNWYDNGTAECAYCGSTLQAE